VECDKVKEAEDCNDERECTWCANSFGGEGSCYSADSAKFLPAQIFTCGRDAEDKPDCMAQKVEDDCLDTNGCSWCAPAIGGDAMASCFSDDIAKFFPAQAMKCSSGDDDDDDDDNVLEKKHKKHDDDKKVECDKVKEAEDCNDERECTWCANSFGGEGSCYSADSAKFLPAQIFTCGRDAEDKPDCMAQKVEDDCLDTNGCSWCAPAIGGDAMASCFSDDIAKFFPAQAMKCSSGDDDDDNDDVLALEKKHKTHDDDDDDGGKKPQCGKLKDEDDCDDTKGCTWCTTSIINTSSCYSDEVAKFLPPQIFKCGDDVDEKKPDCMAQKIEDDCLDTDGCSWCQPAVGGADVASCFSEDVSKFFPAQFMRCSGDGDNVVAVAHDDVDKKHKKHKKHDDDKKVQCNTVMAADDCNDATGCTWCESTFFNMGSCYTEDIAKFLPSIAFKCGEDAEKKPDCMAQKIEDDCLDTNGCSWCAPTISGAGMASCFSDDISKYFPAQMMKCSSGDDDRAEDDESDVPAMLIDEVEKGSKPQCDKLKDEDDCADTDGCTWCTSSFSNKGSGTCYSDDVAKFLPPQVFSCGDDADAAKPVQKCMDLKQQSDCSSTDGCSWCKSTFVPDMANCFPEDIAQHFSPQLMNCAADTARGDDDVETPDNVHADDSNDKCSGAASDGACKSQGCVWCESAAVPGGCYTAEEAKALPPAIFQCDA